ncbi:unnamed protein product [Gordionus sp. m RMFG-2023]
MHFFSTFLIYYFIITKYVYCSNCSYKKKCNLGEPDMINVHIVAHTHDDAGWLKNVDEYYIGSKKFIDKAGVQYIIDSVLKSLDENPDRKFSYVEGSFMQRWLSRHEFQRHQIQRFVDNGQLEILSGGWVMNDEACSHYNDIINQMTLGLKMYKDTFGDCGIPKTGWQIDPFGHSAAQADIFAKLGFDGTFFGRISDDFKDTKSSERGLEFLWHPLPNFAEMYTSTAQSINDTTSKSTTPSDMFISILDNLYQPPAGFCFDILCDDDPIQDDEGASDYNVPEKVNAFLSSLIRQSKNYDTNHLLVTMGNDFNYQAADNWYKNLDKLIKYVNKQRSLPKFSLKFNLIYSTPGCYLYALHNAKGDLNSTSHSLNNLNLYKSELIDNNRPFKSKRQPKISDNNYGDYWPEINGGDFFPLVNFITNIWTGYFSSRPTLKGMIRDSSRFLHICKQIESLSGLDRNQDIMSLERAQAIAQHHDAVTGTAKQAVTYDYIHRLYLGQLECEMAIEEGLQRLAVIKPNQKVNFCPLLNISNCVFTQTQSEFDILLYNPLPWDVEHYVHIPVRSNNLEVFSDKDEPVLQQLSFVPRSINRVPERYLDADQATFPLDRQSDWTLTLKAEVPALGTSCYQIKSTTKKQSDVSKLLLNSPYYYKPFLSDISTLMDVSYKYRQNEINANLIQPIIKSAENSESLLLSQVPRQRKAKSGAKLFLENKNLKLTFDPDTNQIQTLVNKISKLKVKLNQTFWWYGTRLTPSSGAYIFRPNAYEANDISSFFDGIDLEIIKQARQIFSSWLYQEITLYEGASYLEMAWTVGPIPIHDQIPKEIIIRIDSDIRSSVIKKNVAKRKSKISKEDVDDTFSKINKFYTDSNARFMVPRSVMISENINNTQNDQNSEDWDVNFISKQYYPVDSKIFIKDEEGNDNKLQRQLGIVNDRAQGGTSLKEGSLELMLHRRLIYDDSLGVGEPLDEMGSNGQGLIARGKNLLVFDNTLQCNKLMTQLAQSVYLSPQAMFLTRNESVVPTSKQFIFNAFPPNLHLLTLYQWGKRILLRLEHIYSPNEHPELSKSVTIDIKNIFKTFTVESYIEMSLGVNQNQSSLHRYSWPTKSNINFNINTEERQKDNQPNITLNPLDIKTYLLTITMKS